MGAVVKRVYFVRHGETEGNVGKFFQFSDTVLTEAGHRGAQALAQRVRHLPLDTLIASHYTRAQQTAGYVEEVTRLPIETRESFHEWRHPAHIEGILHEEGEGLIYKELHREAFWNPEWQPGDGGENCHDVLERIKESLDFLETHTGNEILVVSHGSYVKHLLSYILSNRSEDPQIHKSIYWSLGPMFNVAISECILEDGKWRMALYNDIAHFAE